MSLQLSLTEQEEKVRPYAELGWPTRKIADEVDMSQTTVTRVIKRINTGPQPILSREYPTQPQPLCTAAVNRPESPVRPPMLALVPLTVLVLVLGVLAAAIATAPRHPVQNPTQRITLCVQRYGHYITGLAATRTTCARGWAPLNLAP